VRPLGASLRFGLVNLAGPASFALRRIIVARLSPPTPPETTNDGSLPHREVRCASQLRVQTRTSSLGGRTFRFRRVQTLVREGSPLVKLRNSAYLRLRPARPCRSRTARPSSCSTISTFGGQQQRLDLCGRRPPSESAITGDRSSAALPM